MAKFILGVHHESGVTGRRLLRSIHERFPDIEQENYGDVEGFKRRLCLPAYEKEKEIIIVLAGKKECLEQLIELKGCLDGRRLALVLYKENREILSRCHLLRPRYVSCEKDKFGDLLSVLEKMINTSCRYNSTGNNMKMRAFETSKNI